MSLVEHLLKELPAAHVIWRLHPDVWGIASAIYLKTEICKSVVHRAGIVHVVVYGCLDLLLTLGSIDSLGSTLTDVAGSVELGALTSIPEMIERNALAGEGGNSEFLGHYRISASDTSESGSLGEAVEFNCHLSCTLYLINRMRNVLVLDISLIGCIIENECIVLNGIVNPLSQFVACNHRSRGVIGITQIDNIHPLVGQCRSEIILG